MSHQPSRADGARVLADLNALRAIGAYKTGVHKPTFSDPHIQSLQGLVQRLPEAGLAGEIDGIGNILGASSKHGPKLLAGSHLESQNHAGWLDGPLGVVYALEAARVIIVVAGMEGALPSVVAGMVNVPVIAVPTSIGYGASFGGVAALLGMLNTCANGVAVVNIDNGFGAGCMASLICHG